MALALAVVACASCADAQSRYTVVAKTMSEAKIVPTAPPVTADRDELMGEPIAADAAADDLPAVKPKPAAKAVEGGKRVKATAKAKAKGKADAKGKAKGNAKAKEVKGQAKAQAKAKAKAKDAKKAVKKAQPGAASAAAKAALPKAPKDQLMRWVRGRAPADTTEAAFKRLELYLDGQGIHTFEDLLSRGEEGIKALIVGDKWRGEFMELLISHIGKSRGVDDGLMVPTPKLVKGGIPKKKSCHRHGEPRFASVPIPATNLVGDWLKRSFPETKPLRMSRTILALERQTIRTFADLRRVGAKGVKRLLYVPDGVREALYEAVLYHIGTEGHDDGKFVPAKPYVPPLPTKADDDCA